ncbi:MAG: hypothetical protein AB1546_04040, partial [bacterium]
NFKDESYVSPLPGVRILIFNICDDEKTGDIYIILATELYKSNEETYPIYKVLRFKEGNLNEWVELLNLPLINPFSTCHYNSKKERLYFSGNDKRDINYKIFYIDREGNVGKINIKHSWFSLIKENGNLVLYDADKKEMIVINPDNPSLSESIYHNASEKYPVRDAFVQKQKLYFTSTDYKYTRLFQINIKTKEQKELFKISKEYELNLELDVEGKIYYGLTKRGRKLYTLDLFVFDEISNNSVEIKMDKKIMAWEFAIINDKIIYRSKPIDIGWRLDCFLRDRNKTIRLAKSVLDWKALNNKIIYIPVDQKSLHLITFY